MSLVTQQDEQQQRLVHEATAAREPADVDSKANEDSRANGSSGGNKDSGASEARLVEAARHGDSDAFGVLVNRYERRLLRVIGRFVNDHEQARDLAQETFLRAYQRLERFDPSRRFGPWLFRVGVNLTLDHLRKRKRRGRWAVFSEIGRDRPPEPAVSDPRAELDIQQEVRMVLSELPENYRSVLVLRDLENFSTSEIAAILNRTEATIRWRLAEARNRFSDHWNRRQNGATKRPITPAETSQGREG